MDSTCFEAVRSPGEPILCYKVEITRHHPGESVGDTGQPLNDSNIWNLNDSPKKKLSASAADKPIKYYAATPTAFVLRQKFFHDLCKSIWSRVPELRDLLFSEPALSNVLTDLLKAFAFKIGRDGSSDGLKAMCFIHRYSG